MALWTFHFCANQTAHHKFITASLHNRPLPAVNKPSPFTQLAFHTNVCYLVGCMQVLVLDDEGRALSMTKGLVTAGELQQSLTRGVAAFSKEVFSN